MRGKTFNCAVHGHLELSALSVRVLDTPQFQRLRDLRQTGVLEFVFSGGTHNRLEHCVGVAHLARMWVDMLRQRQPELGITHADCLAVELAGLLHDLGHGPLSHCWDGKVVPRAYARKRAARKPKQEQEKDRQEEEEEGRRQEDVVAENWTHEHGSVRLFEYLLEENDLMPAVLAAGLNGEEDVHFIQELILGDPSEAPPGFEWRGRGIKTFLYDIVSNSMNGVDVDKFDYVLRDCKALGVTSSFNPQRLMHFSAVLPVRGELHIVFHAKEIQDIHELFHTRYRLHKSVYQHRVAMAIEEMMTDVLLLADDHVRIPYEPRAGKARHQQHTRRGSEEDTEQEQEQEQERERKKDEEEEEGGTEEATARELPTVPLTESIHHMAAYYRVTDWIFKHIEHSPTPGLAPARQLMERLRRRDLYELVGEVLLPPEDDTRIVGPRQPGVASKHEADKRCKEAIVAAGQKLRGADSSLHAADLVVYTVRLSYGAGVRNPVDCVSFYRPQKQPGFEPVLEFGTAQDATDPPPTGLDAIDGLDSATEDWPGSQDTAGTTNSHRNVDADGNHPAASVGVEAVHTSSMQSQGGALSTPSAVAGGGLSSDVDGCGAVYRVGGEGEQRRELVLLGSIPSSSVSHLIPRVFQECLLRVYVKRSDLREEAEQAFRQWCRDQRISSQQLTPQTKWFPSARARTSSSGTSGLQASARSALTAVLEEEQESEHEDGPNGHSSGPDETQRTLKRRRTSSDNA